MNIGAWILIVASHVNAGAVVSMQEFNDYAACERGASAAKAVAGDAGTGWLAGIHTWCVPKSSR